MTSIQYIGLASSLYTEALYFYRDVLNFEVKHEAEGYTTLEGGGLTLNLHPVASESDLAVTGHGFYLSIVVDDLSLVQRNLERAGFGTIHEWMADGESYIRVVDPDGNLLEITGPITDEE